MSQLAGALFPLLYAINGGTPAVDLQFAVDADGACRVDVLTGYSLAQTSPTRLGTFSGRLPADVLAALREWAGSAPVLAQGEARVPGSVSRFVGRGGATPRPVGGEAPVALDISLADLASAALESPVSAIEVRGEGVGTGAGAPRLVILGIGKEAFPLLLFAPDIAGYWPRVRLEDPRSPGGGVFVPYEEFEALVAKGSLKEGIIELAPGERLFLPLPAASGDGPIGGSFIFWRAGTGAERRILSGSWSLVGP